MSLTLRELDSLYSATALRTAEAMAVTSACHSKTEELLIVDLLLGEVGGDVCVCP